MRITDRSETVHRGRRQAWARPANQGSIRPCQVRFYDGQVRHPSNVFAVFAPKPFALLYIYPAGGTRLMRGSSGTTLAASDSAHHPVSMGDRWRIE